MSFLITFTFAYLLYRVINLIGKWIKQKPEKALRFKEILEQELGNTASKPSLIDSFSITEIYLGLILMLIMTIFIDLPLEQASENSKGLVMVFVLPCLLYKIINLIIKQRKQKLQDKERQQQALKQMLDDFRNKPLQPIANAKAIMRNEELAYVAFSAEFYELTSVYFGRWIDRQSIIYDKERSGRIKITSKKELAKQSSGQFVLTNQRVIFIGDQKSFEIILADLIYYDTDSNYLILRTGVGNSVVKMDKIMLQISCIVLDRLLKLAHNEEIY